MTKPRYSFIEDFTIEKKRMKERVKAINTKLDQLHPYWKEHERIKKEKQSLERKLRHML